MFRLEKIFQNDDLFFIKSNILIKSIIIFLIVYIYSILKENTVYDLFNLSIYKNSTYYLFSILLFLFYFIFSLIIVKDKKYKTNFLSFLKYDFAPLILSIIFCFTIFYIFKINIILDEFFLLLVFLIIIFLFFLNKIASSYYNYLIDSNIIQRNIMLVGTYVDIIKVINQNRDKINIYKCCLIITESEKEKIKLRTLIKIPVFNQNEDIRAILEYHSLGQIWVLNNKQNDINILLKDVLKFSVDILIIDLEPKINLLPEELINKMYTFTHYEISKFYGFNLFIKLFTDKILSLFFLLILSPFILIATIIIYLEDGLPIFFTQDRTGWDGRRFRIYKLRSLKKDKFDKTVQVIKGDKRLLKIGKLIRRFSIDELPQFYNVLIGDMSIVGPRPHMVEHDILYADLFESFLKRHKANPGLTGWAQVSGFRGATPTPNLMKSRMEHDLWYLNNWTIWLDFYIIIKTFYVIFKRP